MSGVVRPGIRLFLAASVILWSCGALAAQLGVSPTRIELRARTPTAAVTVSNPNAEPVVVQTQTVTWRREGKEDRYATTTDLIATPPIFTIAPNGTQIVRIGLRRPIGPSRELTYRLFLQEVPQESPKPNPAGVRIVLRLSLPVFVKP